MRQEVDKISSIEFIHESNRIVINDRGIEHCKAHRKYPTFRKGMEAFRVINEMCPGKKIVYKCDHCGLWHITDKPTIMERDAYNSKPFADTYQIRADYLSRCVGKTRFKNRLSAQTFLNLRVASDQTPYPCPSCGMWHVGSKKNHEWVEDMRGITEKAIS